MTRDFLQNQVIEDMDEILALKYLTLELEILEKVLEIAASKCGLHA